MKYEFFQRKVIIIVSGFSNGKYLPLLFNGLGYVCIHVTESRHLENGPWATHLDMKYYDQLFTLDTEEEMKDILEKWSGRVVCIIAGSELGVALTDRLNKLFGLVGNNPSLSLSRRNKYIMHKTLKGHGIAYAKQILSNKVDNILNFFRGSTGKIVLKPPAGANTEGVFYCTDEEQIIKNFSYIIGKNNYINELNEEVLAQEYVDGTQYIVNAISSNGVHYITDIWQEVRENDNLPSNDQYADLLDQTTDTFEKLRAYIFSVLDILGVHTGPSHSEVRIRKDGMPCLIETASRFSGGIDMSIMHRVSGVSSLSLIPDAFLHPERFIETIKLPYFKKINYIRHVYLFSPLEGEIKYDPNINAFLEIDSFVSGFFRFKKGDFLPKTNRAFLKPRPGSVYLMNNNKDGLERDYERVRTLEMQLYMDIL